MDAAGVVDEVGDGVSTGVRVGDAVMAMVLPKGSHGAYREQMIQQISLRVESLDDVRDFKRRAIEKGYTIDRLVTHASAIGLYFRDPEGNCVETFWLTGLPSWAMISVPINIRSARR